MLSYTQTKDFLQNKVFFTINSGAKIISISYYMKDSI